MGCTSGGNGGSGSTEEGGAATAGVFVDAPVAGLGYRTYMVTKYSGSSTAKLDVAVIGGVYQITAANTDGQGTLTFSFRNRVETIPLKDATFTGDDGKLRSLPAGTVQRVLGQTAAGAALKAIARTTLDGYFEHAVNTALAGLVYADPTLSEMKYTDAKGGYLCNEGQKVNFYLGTLLLGTVDCHGVINVYQLAGAADSEAKGVRIAQLLQSLNTGSDGSTIKLPDLSKQTITLDLASDSSTFTQAATQLVQSATGSATKTLVNESSAKAHVTDELKKLSETDRAALCKVNACNSNLLENLVALLRLSLGGTVSGIPSGKYVTLSSGSLPALKVTANGSFKFPVNVATGDGYDVKATPQDGSFTCAVTSGVGSITSASVSNVTVKCEVVVRALGGTVSGLPSGKTLRLADGDRDTISISTNGKFLFTAGREVGESFNITATPQDTSFSCAVSPSQGTISVTENTTIAVTCSRLSYTLGGQVTGLPNGRFVTLVNNGADPVTVNGSGGSPVSFTFPTAVNSTYNATVSDQSAGIACTVGSGSGSAPTANVNTVQVDCASTVQGVTLGGTVSGLQAGKTVSLANGTDTLTVSTNGSFAFVTTVTGSYNVTVSSATGGAVCGVTNASGTAAGTNITDVLVTCAGNSLGGTVSGLTGLNTVTLQNGSDTLTVGNGAYTLTRLLQSGSAYNVSVQTQPAATTCTLSNASGTMGGSNVTNINVSCAPNSYTLSGTLSGLSPTVAGVVIQNGADSITVTFNGTDSTATFTLGQALTPGTTYNVTASAGGMGGGGPPDPNLPGGGGGGAPVTCNVTNGSGTMGSSAVTNISISCS